MANRTKTIYKDEDRFILSPRNAEDLETATRASTQGILCPKKNPSLGGDCAVCKRVSILFNGSQEERELARNLAAKCTWYANVIFPENPNKLILMEMGKKAGDSILYGIKKKEGWNTICHPAKGKGRELKVTKYIGEGQRNAYDVEIALEKATYDIPKEVLDNIYNLDDIITLLQTEEIFRVSQMRIDETLTFRLLPPWNSEKKWPLMFVWRHWGVAEEEIRGEPIEVEEEPEIEREEEPEEREETEKLPCFGHPAVFAEDDEECKACKFYRACFREVAKKVS